MRSCNLEWDPREEHQVGFRMRGCCTPIAAAAGAFLKSMVAEPPIKPGTPDPYTPPKPGTFSAESHLQIGPITQYATSLVQEHDELRIPTTGSSTKPDEQRPHRAAPPGSAPRDADARAELCVLLACFAGAKRAAKIRRQLDERIDESGDSILDQVVVKVDSKHKAQVHDPRRTLAGTLTGPHLGHLRPARRRVESLAVWAMLGAICGGLYACYAEHLLTKDELKRIGGRLPDDSSAIVAFVRAADPRRVLSSTASFQPATASVAASLADLSARVYSSAAEPVESSTAPAGGSATAPAAPGCRAQHAPRPVRR